MESPSPDYNENQAQTDHSAPTKMSEELYAEAGETKEALGNKPASQGSGS